VKPIAAKERAKILKVSDQFLPVITRAPAEASLG
jgi:hypothetical protein